MRRSGILILRHPPLIFIDRIIVHSFPLNRLLSFDFRRIHVLIGMNVLVQWDQFRNVDMFRKGYRKENALNEY